jgi:hypothetical protein
MFMRPQMKKYVYENIMFMEAGHKNSSYSRKT